MWSVTFKLLHEKCDTMTFTDVWFLSYYKSMGRGWNAVKFDSLKVTADQKGSTLENKKTGFKYLLL